MCFYMYVCIYIPAEIDVWNPFTPHYDHDLRLNLAPLAADISHTIAMTKGRVAPYWWWSE